MSEDMIDDDHYVDEHDHFMDEFNEEFFQLIRTLEDTNFFYSSSINSLNKLLDFESITLSFYIKNKSFLSDFLNDLRAYREIDEDEILNNIEAKAGKIVNMLLSSGDYQAFVSTDNTNKKTKELVDINSKINIIKEQQIKILDDYKKISTLNKKSIADHEIALRIVEELKSKNEAYSQLLDEDSNVRILKLYDGIYDREIEIADKYRNWALIIFAIVGLILLLGFLNLSIQNWNHLRNSVYIHIPLGWDSLLKTLMLFSLTTPAWYLTKESSKHRKVAYKAQMLGTELASFPLYVREFKDEDRLELRKHLADRFFGQELFNDSKNAPSSDSSLEQIKLLTEANKVLAEALKAKKAVE
ncbi:hypothetical protein D7V64_03875 [Acinetobacter cumulans]|uniref:Uncharacterized protein n=1 Tax=Acinetobacter cumulans TaxID=2136182 RepID=A0A3A8GI41_9GAMM|nr:hypothetical protein [Acinetobacter cumulans]RKG54724.1 hypothetical protein D7V64_03875 [Acinetobacter cumulans]